MERLTARILFLFQLALTHVTPVLVHERVTSPVTSSFPSGLSYKEVIAEKSIRKFRHCVLFLGKIKALLS